MKLVTLTGFFIAIIASGLVLAGEKGEHRGMKRQAMSECAKEAGVEIPNDGSRHEMMSSLSPEQRSQIHSCMKAKGMGHGGKNKNHNHAEKT